MPTRARRECARARVAGVKQSRRPASMQRRASEAQIAGRALRGKQHRPPAPAVEKPVLTPSGEIQKKLGPAWTGRGRPPAGCFTKRTAEAWLRSTLDEARRGVLPGIVRTGATFAHAAAEWLRYIELDRGRKPSTVAGYQIIVRSQLLPTFGEMAIESITPELISLGHIRDTSADETNTGRSKPQDYRRPLGARLRTRTENLFITSKAQRFRLRSGTRVSPANSLKSPQAIAGPLRSFPGAVLPSCCPIPW